MAYRPNWYDEESRRSGSGLGAWREWSGFRWILTLNVGLFLLQMIFLAGFGPGRADPLAQWGALRAWQLDGSFNWLFLPQFVSYAFLHADPMHLGFNLLFLYFFSPEIESLLGKRGYLRLYMAGAIAGGIVQWGWWLASGHPGSVIGASGAVYTVLVFYALKWPTRQILLMLVLPIPIWLFVLFRVVVDLNALVGGSAGNVAVLVHLTGAAVGAVWLRTGGAVERMATQRKQRKFAAERESGDVDRREMDRILTKIQANGLASLDTPERDFLERRSRELREEREGR